MTLDTMPIALLIHTQQGILLSNREACPQSARSGRPYALALLGSLLAIASKLLASANVIAPLAGRPASGTIVMAG